MVIHRGTGTPTPQRRLGWRGLAWIQSPDWLEARLGFQQACELVFSAVGIHGDARMWVHQYPFKVKEFQGPWVEYRVKFTEGDDYVESIDGEGNVTKHDRPRSFMDPAGRKVAPVSLPRIEEFMVEMEHVLRPVHRRSKGVRWTAQGHGVAQNGQLKTIGEKQLSATSKWEASTPQALQRLNDWLNGVVYSTSDVGAVDEIWLLVKL